MIVLGIDPGLRELGYAFLEKGPTLLKTGTIYTSSELPKGDRLKLIYDRLSDEIERFKPELLCIESVFFARNAKSAMQIGEVRGVILLLCAQRGIDVKEMTPLELKKAITSWGGASKEGLSLVLRRIYGFSPSTSHEADAIALALCGLILLKRHLRCLSI
ncbi:MAG: crossover junction endodeoxyribonuclease RuvC [Synergistetes bacterium]|nr:crossover junction endodeoxyribonuclease RuvC [Synergistota bacterium]